MSHNVTINNVKITNLDALRAAVKELRSENINLELDEEAKTFRTYFGQRNTCDMTIRLPTESFDVGLVKQPDGSFIPVYDDMLAGNRQIACEWKPGDPRDSRSAMGKLAQRYAVCATEIEAALQGHSCVRTPGDNGEINVVIEMA